MPNGQPEGATLITDDRGAALVLRDRLATKYDAKTRLVSLDVATGRLTATATFDSRGKCDAGASGQVWCELDGLRLLDARRLVTVVSAAEPIEWLVEPAGTAKMQLEDGRVVRLGAWVDPVPISGEDVSGWPYSRGDDVFCATLPHGGTVPTGLLEPKVLVDNRTEQAIPDLVVHSSSLDYRRNRQQLSHLDGAGALRWTLPLGEGCQLATVIDGSLLIVNEDASRRAFLVDLETGRERWRFGFDD